jgi:hypothetical protein
MNQPRSLRRRFRLEDQLHDLSHSLAPNDFRWAPRFTVPSTACRRPRPRTASPRRPFPRD